jgi:hypothetical protein
MPSAAAGRAPLREPDACLIAPRVVGVKDDLGAPDRRPSHRLGIAPALTATHHAERRPRDREESPSASGHLGPIFGRVQLVLGLVPLNLTTGVHDKRHILPDRRRESFRPEDSVYRIRARPLRHDLKCPFLPRLIEGQAPRRVRSNERLGVTPHAATTAETPRRPSWSPGRQTLVHPKACVALSSSLDGGSQELVL